MDTIIERFDFPELDQVLNHYQINFHGVDKEGHPVAIQRIGLLNCDELFRISTIPRIQYFNRYWQEKCQKLRYPSCSAVANRKIETLTLINDFSGVTFSTLNKTAFELIKFGAKVGQDYYPETLKCAFIVGAPRVFPFLWSIIKHFLEDDTRQKI